ncbi:hypothetical protein F2Q68_00037075 [Brassica cretica]|uniref:Uncharacterized protein n=1 Tax=Brassica cretica TaxID=69181 RepID=A0A8S9H9G5_BRACR|nr:hypothetical protein F2Q68_00037075 [Brassica cretica]
MTLSLVRTKWVDVKDKELNKQKLRRRIDQYKDLDDLSSLDHSRADRSHSQKITSKGAGRHT